MIRSFPKQGLLFTIEKYVSILLIKFWAFPFLKKLTNLFVLQVSIDVFPIWLICLANPAKKRSICFGSIFVNLLTHLYFLPIAIVFNFVKIFISVLTLLAYFLDEGDSLWEFAFILTFHLRWSSVVTQFFLWFNWLIILMHLQQ